MYTVHFSTLYGIAFATAKALPQLLCRTATLSLRFFFFLNFKPFIIFVSDKKLNGKIDESENAKTKVLILDRAI